MMGRERLWKVPWPEVVPLDEITFGIRHNFVDHYPDEDVEETTFMYPPEERRPP
ncbi:hypothetical protein [Halovenus amylolytica]|uniref:hypothetical protein n=1 Tax=Halovenus amylolytica TaxID=2500550 RepID=UPI0036177938